MASYLRRGRQSCQRGATHRRRSGQMVTGRDEEVKELVLNDPRLGGRNLRIRESGSGIQKADLSLEVEVHGSLHHMVRELSREDAQVLRDWLDEWLSTPPDPDDELIEQMVDKANQLPDPRFWFDPGQTKETNKYNMRALLRIVREHDAKKK
jgi:hypothetical protein